MVLFIFNKNIVHLKRNIFITAITLTYSNLQSWKNTLFHHSFKLLT